MITDLFYSQIDQAEGAANTKVLMVDLPEAATYSEKTSVLENHRINLEANIRKHFGVPNHQDLWIASLMSLTFDFNGVQGIVSFPRGFGSPELSDIEKKCLIAYITDDTLENISNKNLKQLALGRSSGVNIQVLGFSHGNVSPLIQMPDPKLMNIIIHRQVYQNISAVTEDTQVNVAPFIEIALSTTQILIQRLSLYPKGANNRFIEEFNQQGTVYIISPYHWDTTEDMQAPYVFYNGEA